MTNSSSETEPGTEAPGGAPAFAGEEPVGGAAVARFALWPLPDLVGGRLPESEFGSPPPPTPEEAAYAQGYEEGRRQGMDEGNRALKRAAGLLLSAAEALDSQRTALTREAEEAVYLVALAVARHLIDREVTLDPTLIRERVLRGLAVLPVGSRVEIRLNPEDLGALRSQFELPAQDVRANELQWLADPTITRGGCLLETPQRVVDGRVEQVLVDLYHKLRDD